MANRYMDKTVYIRETTDGKTKWIKIEGVTIQNSWNSTRVYIDPSKFTQRDQRSWDTSIIFEQEGRSE